VRTYAWAWRQLAAIYCVTGSMCLVRVMGWGGAVVLLACGVAIGILCAFGFVAMSQRAIRTSVTTGLTAGCFATGVLGAVAAFGPIGLFAGAALGLAAPRSLRLMRSVLIDPPSWHRIVQVLDPGAPEQPPRVLDVERTVPTAMNDADLCAAWRRSCGRLERVRSVDERLRLTRLRETYLDELERREPPAFRAWLATGPATAPDSFLHLGRGRLTDGPPVDLG
jgi:hypothetical protein